MTINGLHIYETDAFILKMNLSPIGIIKSEVTFTVELPSEIKINSFEIKKKLTCKFYPAGKDKKKFIIPKELKCFVGKGVRCKISIYDNLSPSCKVELDLGGQNYVSWLDTKEFIDD